MHNGPLAGLVAICAGSDVMHPLGALVDRRASPARCSSCMFTLTQNRWKIDDVLGVWPLHGLCGAWGGIAAGIFGAKALGRPGRRRVRRAARRARCSDRASALLGGSVVYGVLKRRVGLRLTPEEEFNGADLSIHKIGATPERETSW